MRYKLTRTADIPEELRALGYKTEITIDAGAVWLPDVGKAEGETREMRAFFNGFEVVLKDGDEITQVEA